MSPDNRYYFTISVKQTTRTVNKQIVVTLNICISDIYCNKNYDMLKTTELSRLQFRGSQKGHRGTGWFQ